MIEWPTTSRVNDEPDTSLKGYAITMAPVDYSKFQVSKAQLRRATIDVEEYLRQDAQEAVDKWLFHGSPTFWENP